MNEKKPLTILAFDFGKRFIGVAIGQTLTKTAKPLITLKAQKGLPNWDEIEQLIKKWHADALVVGIPLNMDGTEQKLTHLARQFANTLQKKFNLPVHPVDERLTTVNAREQLFETRGFKGLKKENIDAWAAKLILENWLSENS